MKCPSCADATLLMMERQGVEIDYCPSCRGVWLDRGELDKIIERSTSNQHAVPPVQKNTHDFKHSDFHHGSEHLKRKKSWFSEIFD
jgi:Zn-finger nucleic acid-binding protein